MVVAVVAVAVGIVRPPRERPSVPKLPPPDFQYAVLRRVVKLVEEQDRRIRTLEVTGRSIPQPEPSLVDPWVRPYRLPPAAIVDVVAWRSLVAGLIAGAAVGLWLGAWLL